MKKFLESKSAVAGVIIIGTIILTAFFADFIVPNDPYFINIWDRYLPPEGFGNDSNYILGTDDMGRCVLSRIIMGSRISLLVAGIATSISALLGIFFGAVAGFKGGRIDAILMRFMDVILSFPSVLLAIAIVASLGPGMVNAMFAIAIVRIPAMARITRSMVLSVKQEEYVLAGYALGFSQGRILFKHILMNSFAPILVVATLNMGTAIVVEASLSFLGLGAQPPTVTWGRMLAMGREAIRRAPYITFYPGLAIVLSVLGFNLLGDGLRDIFDPQLKKKG